MGEYYLVINERLKVTPYHPMYANYEWTSADNLTIGDTLINTIIGEEDVYSIEKIYEQVPVYDLELDNQSIYIAENIAVPTKLGLGSYFNQGYSKHFQPTEVGSGGNQFNSVIKQSAVQ